MMNLFFIICMYTNLSVVATNESNRLFSSRSPPSQQLQRQSGAGSIRKLGFAQELPPRALGGRLQASSPTASASAAGGVTTIAASAVAHGGGQGGGGVFSPTTNNKNMNGESTSSLNAAAVVTCGKDPGVIIRTRGGTAASIGTSINNNTKKKLGDLLTTRRKNLSLAVVAIAVLAGLYQYRDVLLNKEKIQDEALRLLRRLKNEDTSLTQSLTIYACGMAVWEFFGLSTIPVETAAGMVFDWPGAAASISGKVVGAVASFSVGRGLLAKYAQAKLINYKLFQQLLSQQKVTQQQQQQQQQKNSKKRSWGRKAAAAETKSSTTNTSIRWQSHPITTSFLMKFSCFPELVKNMGTSLLLSVNVPTFLLATLVHGGIFTLLWTWWGVETAERMVDPTHTTPRLLQLALIGAAVLGVVISPSLMAWWIRDLQLNEKKKRINPVATAAQ